ncbi:DNA alkylation repair protein [Lysinibacillus yapensis]|uniref:DNA alkylation repair protein n=1 Tax=Ureibacillus yapensis TaxID=2304605 RepID=A0A396S3G6_9BACL|nr:DNA alkylation repair protein [Lysinibacillus yapensis]RHW32760.1 DNA alkylation repair protein [Lysinibacillus yapensis]
MNELNHPYIRELVHIYTKHADAEYAEWSKKYLRNQFDFLGIRAPIRRKLTNQYIKEHGLPSNGDLKDIIFCLWDLPEREYQQAALDILDKAKKGLTSSEMPWLSSLIVKKSWWETVDVLSPHIFGYMFLKNDELVPLYAEKWIEDENIWLQRAAILYQLKFKEKTNEERLFRYILRRANSDEFFVQKAIGWALREYAKTSPENVKNFVSQHRLKPLSEREALKHFS